MNNLKLAFFSDTHLREDLIFPDDIDIFFHCGDLLNEGNIREVHKVAKYFKKNLKGRHIYYTPGNHDRVFESSKHIEAAQILKDAGFQIFIDSGAIIILKKRILSAYFCPWIPETIPSHSFNLEEEQRKKIIEDIPNHIDILITHGPPKEVLDGTPSKPRFGDPLLLEKVSSMSNLLIHAFGHVHECRGVMRTDSDSTLFINASSGYSGSPWPIIVNYPECTIPKSERINE